jgi:hypothetical protein
LEIITLYNNVYKNNYQKLNEDEICNIISLIEINKSENIIKTGLKLIMLNINLSQIKNKQRLLETIKKTKSIANLPLRIICQKIQSGKVTFRCDPIDLYKFISGD